MRAAPVISVTESWLGRRLATVLPDGLGYLVRDRRTGTFTLGRGTQIVNHHLGSPSCQGFDMARPMPRPAPVTMATLPFSIDTPLNADDSMRCTWAAGDFREHQIILAPKPYGCNMTTLLGHSACRVDVATRWLANQPPVANCYPLTVIVAALTGGFYKSRKGARSIERDQARTLAIADSTSIP